MSDRPTAEEDGLLVKVLAEVLQKLVATNARQGPDADRVTKFHALKPPSISVQLYLERIHKYASCSSECFVLALIYIDRLIQRNNCALSVLNVHRIVITAVMLAAKFFDDQYFNNAYYAKVGGVPCAEMNMLEIEFLFRINFSLHVPPEVFHKCAHRGPSERAARPTRSTQRPQPRSDPPRDALAPRQHGAPHALACGPLCTFPGLRGTSQRC